jgi:hypothetical protein
MWPVHMRTPRRRQAGPHGHWLCANPPSVRLDDRWARADRSAPLPAVALVCGPLWLESAPPRHDHGCGPIPSPRKSEFFQPPRPGRSSLDLVKSPGVHLLYFDHPRARIIETSHCTAAGRGRIGPPPPSDLTFITTQRR